MTEGVLLLGGMAVGLTGGVMIGACLHRAHPGTLEWSLETLDKLLLGFLFVAAFALGGFTALLLFSM